MTIDESKVEILRRVEQGTLSIEEGAHLLEILENGSSNSQAQTGSPISESDSENHPADFADKQPQNEFRSVPAGWRALWGVFLWLGIVFLGLTGFWLFSSYERSGLGVGFWFALFFLLVSCAIIYFGWQLTASRWLEIRITDREADGLKKFSVWVPLPLQIARWFFRTFGGYLPAKVQSRDIEKILSEMENSMDADAPFVIEVDGEKGANVNVNVEF
ncbi:MAG: hypothetical protein AB9897_01400 [Anaerolineaceae bacterium]